MERKQLLFCKIDEDFIEEIVWRVTVL